MRQLILAPIGRAEPDDVQGWLEHGGGMGLQMAWRLPPISLRTSLSRIQRRDGLGMVQRVPQSPAALTVQLSNPAQRFIAAELPAFIIEGALIWARACEQASVTIHMGRDGDLWRLWREILAEIERIGITGRGGWTGTKIHLAPPAETIAQQKHPLALDALTARLLPLVLWEQQEPPVTLLYSAGAFGVNRLYEIPLGLTIREFAFNWAGGIPADGRLSLGGRILNRNEWNLPLTYEEWGIHLGAGVLEAIPST